MEPLDERRAQPGRNDLGTRSRPEQLAENDIESVSDSLAAKIYESLRVDI